MYTKISCELCGFVAERYRHMSARDLYKTHLVACTPNAVERFNPILRITFKKFISRGNN